MIKIVNGSDVDVYSNLSRLYIPTDYLNTNYSYHINGNYIDIITNNNCFTQYNSTYCDCYKLSTLNDVVSDSYSCNISTNNPKISYDSLSSDIIYSDNIRTTYYSNTLIYLVMFILALVFAKLLVRERSHI